MDEHDERVARLLREVAELLDGEAARKAAPRPAPTHRGPTNAPQHRTWRGFVLDLQALERQLVREGRAVTKTNVCTASGLTVVTITRTMRWYGLLPTDWPPSTWDPDEPREGGKIGP